MAEAASESSLKRVSLTRSLNEFTDDLLVYIISLLPTLNAVQTSAVCRKWRYLWTSISYLNFHFSIFPPSCNSPSDTLHRFAHFVDRVLIFRSHSPLFQFRLLFDISAPESLYSSYVDSWIRYAVQHQAIDLEIDFYVVGDADDVEFEYDFRLCTLKDSCVRFLTLSRCDLILTSNIKCASIHFVHLAYIYLTDEMVSDLISACVNLEVFKLDHCFGIINLRIFSSKLKELRLEYSYSYGCEKEEEEQSVEIRTPNLRSISIVSFETGRYSLKESSNLVEAQVKFHHRLANYDYWSKVVRLFGGVRRLTVQNWWLKFLRQNDGSSERYALNNLNHLELQTGYTKYDLLGIAALLDIAPNLSTMILDYLPKIDEDENLSEELLNKPIHLGIPTLKKVKFINFRVMEYETDFVMLFQKQGVVLEEIEVVPDQSNLSPIVLVKQSQGGEVLRSPFFSPNSSGVAES